ncbi:MAG TPA: amidohydrolase family protein [Dehalococcoidia bacterium]|nr:amidohydrolase family protein [Dehalococcoidia bacterium]
MVATDDQVLVSADSHVMEPHDLWTKALAQRFGDQAPAFPPLKVGEGAQAHPGGADARERIKEMSADGVSAEVLYPTLALRLFGLEDAALQAECFRVYNDWLIDYCQTAPDRLLGVAAIPCYDIDQAVDELFRCKRAGLEGAEIWQTPHPDLPFPSEHYEKLWNALEDVEMPLSLHILTGISYHSRQGIRGPEAYRGHVNLKLLDAANALVDFIHYGILEKHPKLKLVIVENEIGWLPFMIQQWDYYFRRFQASNPLPIDKEPSYYVQRQVYATFFNDAAGAHNLSWWGQDNCMWSNDFPHPNSTWPNSRKVIERDLGSLPSDVRAKLVRENCVRLYGMSVPTTP